MSIEVGHVINWRWQGVKQCCWLTSIEMLMDHKYNNIYGRNQTAHSPEAMDDYKKNKGAHLTWHARHYGLAANVALKRADIDVWKRALALGPVLAEGNYGWSRFGLWRHTILIAGVSKNDNLVYYNPNVFAVLPRPMSKLSYMSLARCKSLGYDLNGGPFWQTQDDVDAFKRDRQN